ncbi:MBL fold metallo-hydrolase [Lutimaribacter sp. EGI FJ00015]|uniref:MBL fold metallo-hydrolase n=1 Tax=Lutimaribacter degradans TaxID=2945989 RepID=A0ACC5ZV31_9RHOB|nr:MBL fold metallo-hydrolase [Lutimaribacter sp. EGI FJ00013]MCM2561414.1 MBL fold metallo-hydrolase [Lutimaribacter sp. EGI FJ00013]MCO0612876.1 MBL fold metallo-hydrolase [Lutimaribacter sp. EGI FJ00015]MCO0635534.1 MBL fold metallo-hydrolase [Lutimaribacter sp. EGI FJ00014]
MTLLKPTRREILKLAAMAPAFALPGAVRAQLGAPDAPNPGHFRFTLGDMRITILSDGFFSLPADGLGVNAPRDEVQAFLEKHYLSPTDGYSHTNHLLVEAGDAKVLVDVGSGNRFMPSVGRLISNMEDAGVDPSEITHVVITHAHPDHIWGIRDDFDEPLFPDAQYFIGQAEHDYWMQDDLVNKVAAEDQQFVLGAVNSITAEGLEWTLLGNDDEIVPGVRVIDTPGHTPGHMSVVVESGGKQLMALGDAMSHAYTNFAHPDWYNNFDADGEQTVATRLRLLDMAAADRISILGYHFPFPGVGHVLREDDSYRFIPALWQFTE